jgi:ABC-type multidrug transport system ATPase subunit
LSGARNLEILASLNRKIGLKEIAAAIRRVGLDPLLKKPVGKYSLGMRQRLGIAQAIMEDPVAVVLDEPLNGLGKHGVLEMRTLIKELRSEGKTILLASHNQGDIRRVVRYRLRNGCRRINGYSGGMRDEAVLPSYSSFAGFYHSGSNCTGRNIRHPAV